MRGLSRRKENLVVILLARGAMLFNSNFYCNVFVLKQEEQEVERGLKRNLTTQPPCLGLQEDDRWSSCAKQEVRHQRRSTVTRQAPCVIIGFGPHANLSLVLFLPGELYSTTYAYVWCSLSPFCGGSCQDADPPLLRDSSKREDSSVNPPARRSGAKPSASVCLPFAILPNQTCLTAAYHPTNHSTTFTRRGLANCGLCFHYCLGQWTQEDWIGPGGSNQAAPSTAYQCANKRLVKYGAKNQTIQLPTSLAAQSISIAKFLDSPSSSTSRRNPTTSSSLVTTRRIKRRSSQCQRLLSLKLN